MSENNEKKQQEERRPHFVKTIGKTTYLVTCHFSETSRETLHDKMKVLNTINFKKSMCFYGYNTGAL